MLMSFAIPDPSVNYTVRGKTVHYRKNLELDKKINFTGMLPNFFFFLKETMFYPIIVTLLNVAILLCNSSHTIYLSMAV